MAKVKHVPGAQRCVISAAFYQQFGAPFYQQFGVILDDNDFAPSA
jgi:hypothetical protein